MLAAAPFVFPLLAVDARKKALTRTIMYRRELVLHVKFRVDQASPAGRGGRGGWSRDGPRQRCGVVGRRRGELHQGPNILNNEGVGLRLTEP